MDYQTVMKELESLGKERTKKIYLKNGAREPLFGVNTGAMKPLSRQIKQDQDLAEELYASGNYDAMYFAGVIADPLAMTEADFNRWLDQAYFYMISDFVVAVTLTESSLNQTLADQWIQSSRPLDRSAGWSTYCWSLGRWPDEQFDQQKMNKLLKQAQAEIADAPDVVKASLVNFIQTVGISYRPLHQEALKIAEQIGSVEIMNPQQKIKKLSAYEQIQKQVEKDRIGFKRKYVRC
ncbi:DNA alkylation repair protein [Ignavigranum ruoffiae]|uniref:DNA alkylation repair protein n=1 Tax=Ignavigranum ruoffiae TaxID=89093 RepID=UPI003AFF7467